MEFGTWRGQVQGCRLRSFGPGIPSVYGTGIRIKLFAILVIQNVLHGKSKILTQKAMKSWIEQYLNFFGMVTLEMRLSGCHDVDDHCGLGSFKSTLKHQKELFLFLLLYCFDGSKPSRYGHYISSEASDFQDLNAILVNSFEIIF